VELSNVLVSREGTSFSLVFKKPEQIIHNLFVPIPGEVQAKNAGLAVLALRTAFPGISEVHIRKGLSGFTLPARFETVCAAPLIIVDGAHTKHSMKICIDTFVSLYGAGAILIFGCAAGKDVHSMAELCVPHFSRIIITTPGSFKKSFPEEIYGIFSNEAQNLKSKPEHAAEAAGAASTIQSSPPEVIFIPDTAKALDMAVNLANESGFPILGTGSFYLAGELRNKLKSRPHS